MIQSLGKVDEAQKIAEAHETSQFVPSQFVKAQMDVDKALQKIADAKVEVYRYYATTDDWIRSSVGHLLGGFTQMEEIIGEIRKLMKGKLDRPLEVKDSDLFLKLESKFSELALAKDSFYQGAVYASYALVDQSKTTEEGATHLNLTRQQKRQLDQMSLEYLNLEENEKVSFESDPAKASIAVIYDFLNQNWAMSGESVREKNVKIKLFSDRQLNKINAATDQIQTMDDMVVYNRRES